MKLLLDTHSLIWWFDDDQRLGQRARAMIADSRSTVLVSSFSFWEMSIKHRIGKLDHIGSVLMQETLACGFDIVALAPEHLAWLEKMPSSPDHKDPFDHIILAQAAVAGAILITDDAKMRGYGIRCIPA